ncbi:MAG: hypothetical protein M1820_009058 [Bogoriella megaspora]|nr:MAG: hypothetical protein M1820_009058 [Bogoriella megaspora]
MRIRKGFAGAFVVTCLASAYLGLAPVKIPDYYQSDKVLHFVTFFVITTCFYWVLETNRRRQLQFTLLLCTAFLGIGSEILQGFLPNGREFDLYDIVANVAGSLAAVGLSTWYHKRMLERKRQAKYDAVPGEEDGERDLELGENIGPQESGVVNEAPTSTSGAAPAEDNWDNDADNWEEEGRVTGTESGEGDDKTTPATSIDTDMANGKRRDD